MRTECQLNTIVCGDFNRPGINWDDMTSDKHGERLLECSMDLFLSQHVNDTTRNDAILDLIFSQDPNIVQNVSVLPDTLQTGDHNIITFLIDVQPIRDTTNKVVNNFKRADFLGAKEHLSNITWENEFANLDVNKSWDRLKHILKFIEDNYVPKRAVKRYRKPIWMDKVAFRSCQRRNKMRRINKQSKTAESLANYLSSVKIANNEKKRSRLDFEHKLGYNIKTDSKSLYAYVRSKSRSKDSAGPVLDSTNNLIFEPHRIASTFNDYFTSVFTQENTDTLPQVEPMLDPSDEIADIEFSEEDVDTLLTKLKDNKSPGVDNIHPAMLKNLHSELKKPLYLLFRKSLDEGTVPNDWKMANVAPIHKKGNKKLTSNFRPVSLTSMVGKLLERLINQAIMTHLSQHNLINDTQHGFLPKRSCQTNLLLYLELLTSCIDKGLDIDVLYLDFAKAFDKVPHKRLLKKVQAHGVSGKVYSWIENWLMDRKQQVKINSSYSGWNKVTSGVPQGSILGPTLFLMYINDIEENLNSTVLKFADDTKVMKVIDNHHCHADLQNDIKGLEKWAKLWQMQFNVDKCKMMHFGFNNTRHTYTMNNKELQTVSEEKDLGVIIQDNLKVDKQVAASVAKANKMLGMIRRSFKSRDEKMMLQLYKSVVRPHVEFAISSWSPHFKIDIEAIEKIQHRFTRLLPRMKHLSYEDRLIKLNLTTLERRRERGDIIQTYKIMHGLSDVNINELFTMVEVDWRQCGNILALCYLTVVMELQDSL